MKQMIIILGIILSLSCNGDDDNDIQYRDELLGKWKLIEVMGFDGGPTPWRSVKKGYTYTFDGSGNLISDRFSCNGTFEETLDEVSIEFDCPADRLFRGKYVVSFEQNKLILSGIGCDDGCLEKFKRIK